MPECDLCNKEVDESELDWCHDYNQGIDIRVCEDCRNVDLPDGII